MWDVWALLLIVAGAFTAFIMAFYLSFFARSARQSRQVTNVIDDINNTSPFRKPQPLMQPHNERLFDKNLQKEQKIQQEANISGTISRYNPDGIAEEKQHDDTQIVGVAEPQGFWSRFIMSQKIGYIIARMGNQAKRQGFWVNLIKAQSNSQGKDQSRGR